MNAVTNAPFSSRAAAGRERGVVLLYTLIALVIMLIAGVALVRSFNSSLFNAGNLAFKRDLANQGELARQQVMAAFAAGGLSTEAQRNATQAAQNYSAIVLPSNGQGIPAVLVASDDTFSGQFSGADLTVPDQGVTVRYVIDRQCQSAGNASLATCLVGDAGATQDDNTAGSTLPPIPSGVIYRLSIRVQGPRDTLAFLQSTFTP